MAILALGLIFAACGFYGYVLVQFQRDEKLPRRTLGAVHRCSDSNMTCSG